jgi:23S rRNA (guanosine2251-2'-O)-methyltransferase
MPEIIFGRHPVAEAIKDGTTVERVMLQQGTRGEMEIEMRHLCRDYDIPLQIVPKEKLQQLTRGNHQGVIAFISPVPFYKLEDVLPGIYERGETPLILILDGVTDVRNFGAIARSAACTGVHTIVIPQKGSATITPEAVKASAGALLKIPVCRTHSLVNALDFLHLNGLTTFAADVKGKSPVYKMDMSVPCAIIVGSEDEGIQQALLSRVSHRFFIPQTDTTDSFNVSVATGITLYEVMRQRAM